MKEFKLLKELEKVEKLTIKGVYSPSEAVKTKLEITLQKLGLYFTEDNFNLLKEIKPEFLNFQNSWANSYKGD
jgi:hypothetical protein